MNVKRTNVGVGIWFAWMLASAVGWAIAFPVKGDFLWPWGWLISGALTGVLQAILLRQCVESSDAWKWWGLASIIGWMGACLVIGTVSFDTTDMKTLATILMAGIPAGVLQWLALRLTLHKHIATLATWIVTNILGIGMAVTVTVMVNVATGYIDNLIAQVMAGGLFGMIQGAITGGVLMWQLGQLSFESKNQVPIEVR